MSCQDGRTFDSTARTPAEVRHYVRALLDEWGLAGVADRVLLAVSELATNAVVHGGGPVQLSVGFAGGRLRVDVADDGEGMPSMRSPDARGREGGGWGLRLLDSIVDTWGSEGPGRGTVVWFEVRVPDS